MPLTLYYYKGLTEGLNVVVAFTFYGYRINLVPRVLSLASRKNPGCSVGCGWLRGMSVNKLRGGDRSPIKFCRLDDEILSGVGRKFLLQNDA